MLELKLVRLSGPALQQGGGMDQIKFNSLKMKLIGVEEI